MISRTSDVAVCCSSDSVRSGVLGLHLVEQPDVLDGDHGLVSEGLKQLRRDERQRCRFVPA